MDTTLAHQTHRATFGNGLSIALTEQQATRALYALTSLAQTPLIDHLKVHSVFDANGECLWSKPANGATP
jgi:hypothetical protein